MAEGVYTWSFLRETAHASVWVAAGVAVLGSVLSGGDWRFPMTLALAAVFDIGTLLYVVGRAEDPEAADADLSARSTSALLAGRLVLKALLLGLAAALPSFLSLWGMAAGMLVVDTTIMTVGSFRAAARLIRQTPDTTGRR